MSLSGRETFYNANFSLLWCMIMLKVFQSFEINLSLHPAASPLCCVDWMPGTGHKLSPVLCGLGAWYRTQAYPEYLVWLWCPYSEAPKHSFPLCACVLPVSSGFASSGCLLTASLETKVHVLPEAFIFQENSV